MRLKDLLRILLVNSLFATVVNLLFLTEWAQAIWQNWQYAIILGLMVYGLQGLLITRLLKPYRKLLAIRESLSFKPFVVGFSVAILVWAVAQGAALVLKNTPVVFPTESRFFRILIIFVFNTIIGAFYEEIVFRFVPVQFCRQSDLGKGQLLFLLLGITLLFAITHLSAYLFRDQINIADIGNALWNPFFSGIFFLLVYLGTKNIYFVSLIHAFGNNGLYIVETPYAFVTILVVTLLWAVIHYRQNAFSFIKP